MKRNEREDNPLIDFAEDPIFHELRLFAALPVEENPVELHQLLSAFKSHAPRPKRKIFKFVALPISIIGIGLPSLAYAGVLPQNVSHEIKSIVKSAEEVVTKPVSFIVHTMRGGNGTSDSIKTTSVPSNSDQTQRENSSNNQSNTLSNNDQSNTLSNNDQFNTLSNNDQSNMLSNNDQSNMLSNMLSNNSQSNGENSSSSLMLQGSNQAEKLLTQSNQGNDSGNTNGTQSPQDVASLSSELSFGENGSSTENSQAQNN